MFLTAGLFSLVSVGIGYIVWYRFSIHKKGVGKKLDFNYRPYLNTTFQQDHYHV